MMRVLKRTEAYYEVKDASFGQVYRWRPGLVVIECGCGQIATLTNSFTSCDGCATEHAALFRGELLARPLGEDEAG